MKTILTKLQWVNESQNFSVSLFSLPVSPDSKTINAVLLAVVGFFIGGPANLISSAISADLGKYIMMFDSVFHC